MATSYPYLGTILTPSGSFNVNNKHLYNKGLRIIFSIMKDFNPQFGTPIKILLKLSDFLVRPIILYNCEVWGAYSKGFNSVTQFKQNLFHANLLSEELHTKMCKMILGGNSTSSNAAVHVELGGFPLDISL